MIRRSSLTVSGSSCSSSEGKSSGWRPIQAPTYRFGGSVTLASRRSRKDELETCFEHSLNVWSHKAKTQSNKLSLYKYTYNNGFQCVLVVLSHSRRREFCKRLCQQHLSRELTLQMRGAWRQRLWQRRQSRPKPSGGSALASSGRSSSQIVRKRSAVVVSARLSGRASSQVWYSACSSVSSATASCQRCGRLRRSAGLR